MARVLSKHLAAANCTLTAGSLNEAWTPSEEFARAHVDTPDISQWRLTCDIVGPCATMKQDKAAKAKRRKQNPLQKNIPLLNIARSFQVSQVFHLHRFGIALWQVTGEEIGPG